ncbi:MAG: hypothetical protein KDB61_14705, partial [Planctomycetes bacterium]|nr:hypothetical protein [Planctomycetota bacterium]
SRPIGGDESVTSVVLYRDLPVALGFSLVLLLLPFLPKSRLRYKGAIVFIGYFAYMAYLMSVGIGAQAG